MFNRKKIVLVKNHISSNQNAFKQEILHTTNDVVRLCRRMCEEQKNNRYSESYNILPLLHHLHHVNDNIEGIAHRISKCIENKSLIQQIKIGSQLKAQIQNQISNCALLEMKNISIRNLSHQLKTELIRLNQLQAQWFNMSCLKN